MRHLAVCVALLSLLACSSKKAENAAPKEVRVAAASDLATAFAEVGTAFEKKTGIKPNFNFSSSGLLAKQIEQGAPFFLFAAANKSF
ncbi:MAG TPA: substrate-binding domain-containing protein, partial [Kofleriaceae bacterium]